MAEYDSDGVPHRLCRGKIKDRRHSAPALPPPREGDTSVRAVTLSPTVGAGSETGRYVCRSGGGHIQAGARVRKQATWLLNATPAVWSLPHTLQRPAWAGMSRL